MTDPVIKAWPRADAPDPAAAMILSAIPAEDPDAVRDVAAARSGYEMLGTMGGADRVPDGRIEVTDGAVAGVPVRWYRPTGATGPQPCLVFFHGGGFTIGSLDSHDAQCRQTAHLADAVVVSVHYRLAPEHRYPAAFEDCEAVVAALLDGADAGVDVAIDPARIGTLGNSAGGTLSASVSQTFAGRLRFQGLLYPAVDWAGTFPSMDENATGYLLTKATMAWFTDQFVPDEAHWTEPRLSPLRGRVGNTPPAWVLTCGFDPLRDQGAAYAEALTAAGIPTVHRHEPDQIHEVVQLAGIIPKGQELLEDLCATAKAALAR